MDAAGWKQEVVDQKQQVAHFANIPVDDVSLRHNNMPSKLAESKICTHSEVSVILVQGIPCPVPSRRWRYDDGSIVW